MTQVNVYLTEDSNDLSADGKKIIGSATGKDPQSLVVKLSDEYLNRSGVKVPIFEGGELKRVFMRFM